MRGGAPPRARQGDTLLGVVKVAPSPVRIPARFRHLLASSRPGTRFRHALVGPPAPGPGSITSPAHAGPLQAALLRDRSPVLRIRCQEGSSRDCAAAGILPPLEGMGVGVRNPIRSWMQGSATLAGGQESRWSHPIPPHPRPGPRPYLAPDSPLEGAPPRVAGAAFPHTPPPGGQGGHSHAAGILPPAAMPVVIPSSSRPFPPGAGRAPRDASPLPAGGPVPGRVEPFSLREDARAVLSILQISAPGTSSIHVPLNRKATGLRAGADSDASP